MCYFKTPMNVPYFIDKLSSIPEDHFAYSTIYYGHKTLIKSKEREEYNISKDFILTQLTGEEVEALVLLFGCQFTACNDGESRVFGKYGITPRERILNYLNYLNSFT